MNASLETNGQNNKARTLEAAILRRIGKHAEAGKVLSALLEIDPLDHWARWESALLGRKDFSDALHLNRNDAQTMLDIAFDYSDAGFPDEAIGVLECHHSRDRSPEPVPNPQKNSQLTHYALAWLYAATGHKKAKAELSIARRLSADFCFPSRLHEYGILQWALARPGADRNAAYGLGNFCYDRKRHRDAIEYWESARRTDPSFATVHRNLGIAYWNILRDGKRARQSYQKALACASDDALLMSEYDQLRKKLGDSAKRRLEFLRQHESLVLERDDSSVEMAALYNQTGQPQKALDLLLGRSYHPWEGGEGKTLRQYTTAHLLLGRQALQEGRPETALDHFDRAMDTPNNLGEKYHPLQAKADVNYWIGEALNALGSAERRPSEIPRGRPGRGRFPGHGGDGLFGIDLL